MKGVLVHFSQNLQHGYFSSASAEKIYFVLSILSVRPNYILVRVLDWPGDLLAVCTFVRECENAPKAN